MKTQKTYVQIYSSLLTRVQSNAINGIITLLLFFTVASILDKIGVIPDWVRALLFISIWSIYEPVCTVLGGTLGNYIMNIRVRRFDDPSLKITIFQAYARFFVKFLFGGIAFITIFNNEYKRALHDLVAGTIVLERKRIS